jgi:outer membrane immunogenic protein
MYRLSAALTCMIATSGLAAAADFPVYKAPASGISGLAWSGYYVGAHAGYSWFDRGVSVSYVEGTPANVPATVAAGALPLNFPAVRGGVIGGGQVGFNRRFDNWVLGLETDLSGIGRDSTQTRRTSVAPFFPLTTSVTQDLEWFGTLRARAGQAWGNWLLYGTGGLAYGSFKYQYTQSNTPAGTVNIAATDSDVKLGWTLGGGTEYSWGQWSTKLEYLYFDLGHHTLAAPMPTAPAVVFFPRFSNTGHIVRVGINYRL